MIQERVETYDIEQRNTAKINLMARWQEKWTNGTYGRWTWRLIPNIQRWIQRPYGEVDYFLTQALSGHGCFRKYLHDRQKTDSEACIYCRAIDDVEHTLFACPRWEEVRNNLAAETGSSFNDTNMMENLTTSEETWKIAYKATVNESCSSARYQTAESPTLA
ncbi:hypothetical protein NQ318_013019 [Aromia moschata]|uniref:Reverse transcriptase zinc-binding domain-containing protein n=1 Tax=Aromia moschata TaxID=1265417 RepID=A0AAV8XGQ3_9CUCU|nr:hypothetical protein NQ318_013019 [Aromia moschata]